jgi:hypothetical protein
MLSCVERLERNTREKERACIELLFSYCKLLVVEIKQCVLSPMSVSKPPLVVSPTNNWYQSPVRQKTEEFWNIPKFSKLSNTF